MTQAQEEGLLPPGSPLPHIATHWTAVHGLALLVRDQAAGRLFGLPLGNLESDDLYDQTFERLWQ